MTPASVVVVATVLICAHSAVIDATLPTGAAHRLLSMHNQLRSDVARGRIRDRHRRALPSAADMHKLRWSRHLARTAQAWANRCVMTHSRGSAYGENLAAHTSGDIVAMTNAWFEEIDRHSLSKYAISKFRRADVSTIGHFTQAIWGKTTRIGCGYRKSCKIRFSNGSKRSAAVLVCHYSHKRGNIIGQRIYTPGRICQKCKGGCRKTEGLCH